MVLKTIYLFFIGIHLGALGCERHRSSDTKAKENQTAQNHENLAVLPYAKLFDTQELPSFYLTVKNEDIHALNQRPKTYRPATFRYVPSDGTRATVLKKVGIRLKGNYSFRPLRHKAAFKIKFGEFVPGQKLLGLRRLTLNNMMQDPSTLREILAYTVYRAAGAPAPLCNHARLYINDIYYGLYANVESLDRSFLKRFQSAKVGNLYDTMGTRNAPHVDLLPGNESLFQKETNASNTEKDDLKQLIATLADSDNRFYEKAKKHIDIDEFLLIGAVQAVIADWDGYFGSSNNYKLYRLPTNDRFILLPWGTDQTFNIWGHHYNKLNYTIDASQLNRPRGVVFTKCLEDKRCCHKYIEKVKEVLDIFESLDLHALIDSILLQSQQAIETDTRARSLKRHTLEKQEESVEVIRDFVDHRGDIVFEQLFNKPICPE